MYTFTCKSACVHWDSVFCCSLALPNVMSHKRPGLSSGAVSTSLAAAALQDHLARQLSLSLSDPLLSKKTQGSLSFHSSRAKRENRIPAVRQTGDPLPESKSSKRDRGQRLTRNGAVEVERVLDPHPPPLSLAQHMGLVERPHPLLTSKEWSQVKIVSQQRQDSSQPCPICQEEFGMSEQVSGMHTQLTTGHGSGHPSLLSYYFPFSPSDTPCRYCCPVPMSSTDSV